MWSDRLLTSRSYVALRKIIQFTAQYRLYKLNKINRNLYFAEEVHQIGGAENRSNL